MANRKPKSKGTKPASIRGIAELTGFSNTTVSLVLNGRARDYNITDKTRNTILEKAREVNYQPNVYARTLRSGKSDILGLMVPTLRNRFFAEMAEAFEAKARSMKKLALIHVTRYDKEEEESAIRYFLSQKADCVFVANPMNAGAISELCESENTRQIFIDATAKGENTVSTDNFEGARELTRALIQSMKDEQQYGPICFFGGPPDHQVTQTRLAGFQAALTEAGLSFSDDQVVWCPFDVQKSYQTIRDFFETRPELGGMFVNSVLPMEGLVQYFPENLDQCKLIHYGIFDDFPFLSLLTGLKTVNLIQDSVGIMNAAFELLNDKQSKESKREIMVPYRISHR